MLSITEQQQVLVLFPNSKIGFEVTVEEVDSNFEIFSLLQIALAKEGYMDKLGLPNYKYNEEIDRLLRRDMSKGAQNAVVDEAAFNYYTLHPINKGNRGHYRLDADYLCEGQEQINAFGTLDGRLILLADKCTVKRSWANAAALGMHPNLHPTLTINRVLPKEEYEKWVDMVESIGTYQQDKADE